MDGDAWSVRVAAGKYAGLPPRGARFRVVYADPPWEYPKHPVEYAIAHTYNTESSDSLLAFARYVGEELTARDAILYLWTVNPKLAEVAAFVRAAGFSHATLALVYTKRYPRSGAPYVGMGSYTRTCVEPLLVAVKGRGVPLAADAPPVLRYVHALAAGAKGAVPPPPIVLAEPIGTRTRKPECVHELIERAHGACVPRIELFARCRRPGWWVWGSEPDLFEPARVPSAAWWRARIAAAHVYDALAEAREDFADEDARAVDSAVRAATGYDPDAP